MPGKFLMTDEVLAQLKISRTTLYEMIKEKEFPPSGKRGGAAVWFQDDIDNYIKRIRVARDNSPEYKDFISTQDVDNLNSQPSAALDESAQL